MKLGPLALMLILVPVSMATAQPYGWEQRRVLRHQDDSYHYTTRGPYEQVCMRWCPHDMVPCDPPHYKIADGRCSERRGGNR